MRRVRCAAGLVHAADDEDEPGLRIGVPGSTTCGRLFVAERTAKKAIREKEQMWMRRGYAAMMKQMLERGDICLMQTTPRQVSCLECIALGGD